MHSLSNRGSFPFRLPLSWLVNPLSGNTTDRRAVCGRTARTVRRGERPGTQPVFPTPILTVAPLGLKTQRLIVFVVKALPFLDPSSIFVSLN